MKANFAEIEREATMADQLKVQAAEEAQLMAEKTAEEEQKQVITDFGSSHLFIGDSWFSSYVFYHVDVGSVAGIVESMLDVMIIGWFFMGIYSICIVIHLYKHYVGLCQLFGVMCDDVHSALESGSASSIICKGESIPLHWSLCVEEYPFSLLHPPPPPSSLTNVIFKSFWAVSYASILGHFQIASMRLAYQDLSLQQKKEQEKLKQVDPMKAQQIERLGMGFASRT